jgi:flagellar hook-associated protein 1 FlgK
MGLTSALNTALFGIQYNQKQIEVTASNISNADTAGYSKKTVSVDVFFDGQGNVSGIQSTQVVRVIDERIQSAYFDSLAETNYAAEIAAYTESLDRIFGTVGDESSLTSLVTSLSTKLSAMTNDPGSFAAQQEVVAAAEEIARELNSSYEQIQELRLQADRALTSQAETIGDLLQSIEDIDVAILETRAANATTAELEDQRDRYIEQLSGYLDIKVADQGDGNLLIRTSDGQQLYANNKASTISFNGFARASAGAARRHDRGHDAGGTTFDLLAGNESGSIAALAELRDEVLVEAQTQLDTIAAELSLAFSNVTVDSTATTVGLESGFVLDLSALQAGNTVSLSYVDSAGDTQDVTFVGVTDPTLLPLSDDATSKAGDTVYGIDISGGATAGYITQIIAALAATDLNVSNDGSDNLQVLGDTATTTVVNSLSADVTVSASTDQGLGFSVFVDQTDGSDTFTDALEDGGQRVGYAYGIAVNPELLNDSSLLVTYETIPANNSVNDASRSQYLLNALTNDTVAFDPGAGIGSQNSPFQSNVMDYINQVTAYQGNQAQDAATYDSARQTITTNFAQRYEESYAVDVDAELAFLIELENAYAASARVMQTVNELYDVLLNTL